MPSFESIRNGFIRIATCGSINPDGNANTNITHGAQRGPQPGNRPPSGLRRFIDAIRPPRPDTPRNESAPLPAQAIARELPTINQSNVAFPDFLTYTSEEQARAPVVATDNQQRAASITDQIRENEDEMRMTPDPIIRPPVVLSSSSQTTTSFIDRHFHDDVRADLHTKFSKAEELLASGPIILGERHDRSAARAVLLDLISRGMVTNLFLELGSLKDDIFTNDEGGHSKNVSEHLRERAKEGKELATDDLWTKGLSELIGLLDKQHNNPIGMVEVIELAVANGVNVHFSDNAITRQPSSAIGMRLRNQETGRLFVERKGNQPGSVILIGAGHTEMRATGTSEDTTVQACAGVDANRVMDLSGREYPKGSPRQPDTALFVA